MEAKRLEYERLKAEGKTNANVNTSKKNARANEKQKLEERKAALERAERAARRERLGIADNELPPSQVGNRRYARGRNYDPNRFANPETVAEVVAAPVAEEAVVTAAETAENQD